MNKKENKPLVKKKYLRTYTPDYHKKQKENQQPKMKKKEKNCKDDELIYVKHGITYKLTQIEKEKNEIEKEKYDLEKAQNEFEKEKNEIEKEKEKNEIEKEKNEIEKEQNECEKEKNELEKEKNHKINNCNEIAEKNNVSNDENSEKKKIFNLKKKKKFSNEKNEFKNKFIKDKKEKDTKNDPKQSRSNRKYSFDVDKTYYNNTYSTENFTSECNEIYKPVNSQGSLYLGDYFSAKNFKLLKTLNVKSVLTIANGLKVSYKVKHKKYEIDHLLIPALDIETYNISVHFNECFEFIEKGLAKGSVLVHCAAGVSRSATIVITYLMQANKWTYKHANRFVRKRRNVIWPNSGFVKQMYQFEKSIENPT